MNHSKFFSRAYRHPEPGTDGGGTTPAPAPAPAEPPAAAPAAVPPAPPPDAAPAPAEPPAEPFKGLEALLDGVGKEPASPIPAPAAPAPASPAPGAPAPPAALDLAPPEGLNDRSKTRWTELADRAKQVPELERRATEATQQLDGVRQMVAASGLQADEFTNILEIGRLFKSSTPAEMTKALQELDGLRADLATRLGVDAPGVDPLAKHADLRAEVDAMTISRERALEIAALRHKGGQADAISQEQRNYQQFQTNVQQAATRMDGTLQQRAGQPGHAEKLTHIKAYFSDPAKLQQFVTTYQPSQWESAVLMMYDSFAPPVAAPTMQPLRPTNTRSGVAMPNGHSKVTAESAVMGAFDRLGL